LSGGERRREWIGEGGLGIWSKGSRMMKWTRVRSCDGRVGIVFVYGFRVNEFL